MKNSFLIDFDLFAKRLGLFYNKKERIGSYFGISLSIIYIVSSLLLFIYYTIITVKRKILYVSDSVIYPHGIPYIDLNNSDLFYLAFGIKNKENETRFVDEEIYTAKAFYFYNTKNSDGYIFTQEKRELKIEKCKVAKFGINYQRFFAEQEFNNSYCIDKFDFALTGGLMYKNYSYIRIQIYPCVNTTENNNHCKPKNLIDNALRGGYFYVLLKDIGLNPSNYTFPILPTIQNFYTTISKKFLKDIIFFYEITEVETDTGIFFENKNSFRYLKLDRIKESISNYTEEENYYIGENICKADIILSENIHIQKRSYSKMSSVFSVTGGYMQIIYTLFSLLILIPNNFGIEKIIINNLLSLDIKFEKKRISNFKGKRNSTIFDTSKKDIINLNKSPNRTNDIDILTNENLNLPKIQQKRNSINIGNIFMYGKKTNSKNPFFGDYLGNISFMEHSNNASKMEMNPKQPGYSIIGSQNFGEQSINKSINRSINKSINRSINNNINRNNTIEFFENIKSKGIKRLNINIFQYFCFRKLVKRKKDIDIFDKSAFIYKERMDFINLFRDLLVYENCLKENFHFEKNGLNEEEKFYSNKIIKK